MTANIGSVAGVVAGTLVTLAILFVFVALPLIRLGSDRQKLSVGHPAPPPWSGRYTQSAILESTALPSSIDQIAQGVLESVGAVNIVQVDEATVLGWRGRWGILNHGQRELAIRWEMRREGGYQIAFWSRPRFRTELLDLGLSSQLVKKMKSRLSQLSNGQT